MKITPLNLDIANEFIRLYHRHNLPVVSGKFAIGCEKDNKLIGVAIAGRPISRMLDNGLTLEVYRVCTDGTKNAVSFLYSRCKRIGQLMGYEKIITYTLQDESGSSLRAIGAIQERLFSGQQWNSHRNGERKYQKVFNESKIRWELK